MLREALDLCDLEVRQALAEPFRYCASYSADKVKETSLREIDGRAPGDSGLTTWFDTFCIIQWAEIWSSLGGWVEAEQPAFGPRTKNNFELGPQPGPAKNRTRQPPPGGLLPPPDAFLGPHDLLCLPTTPALAPVKGTLGDEARSSQSQLTYYPRTLSLTSIAGIGRLPQVTLPLGNVGGVPVGLSLAGRLWPGCLLAGGGQTGGRRRGLRPA